MTKSYLKLGTEFQGHSFDQLISHTTIVFAKEGAKVIVADLNLAGAEKVVEGIISNGGVAKAMQVNVAKLEDIENMMGSNIRY